MPNGAMELVERALRNTLDRLHGNKWQSKSQLRRLVQSAVDVLQDLDRATQDCGRCGVSAATSPDQRCDICREMEARHTVGSAAGDLVDAGDDTEDFVPH